MRTKRWVWSALIIIGVSGAAAVVWMQRRGYSQVVSLDVQNLEIRSVAREVQRQAGVSIIVNDGVQGTVTLYLHQTPLDLALRLIGRQVHARSGHVFPLYTSPAALADLKALVTLQSAHSAPFPRWTNFNFHHAPGSTPRGKTEVNLHVDNREARLAAMAVSYAVHAQVVTEDGLAQSVKLDLEHGKAETAVASLAQELHCQWSSFYYLRPAKLGHVSGKTPAQKAERKEAKLEACSPEKRERKEELRSLTRDQWAELKELRSQDPGFQQHAAESSLNKIREHTPEEIVEHRRQAAKASKHGHGK